MARRRGKDSGLDELLDVLVRVPFWVGPLLACAAYALVRWGAAWALSHPLPNNPVAATAQPILAKIAIVCAPLAAVVVLFVWLVSLWKKIERRKQSAPRAGSQSPPAERTGPPSRPGKPAEKSPACPSCGSAMVLRTAKQGQNAGSRFWGCPRYPACRGTRELARA